MSDLLSDKCNTQESVACKSPRDHFASRADLEQSPPRPASGLRTARARSARTPNKSAKGQFAISWDKIENVATSESDYESRRGASAHSRGPPGRSRSCGSSLSSACSTPRSARCSPLSAAHSSGNLSAAASSAGGDTPITVVVHVRPLVEREHSSGSCIDGNDRQGRDALSPEVMVQGNTPRTFPFDKVYGSGGAPSAELFGECVAPLVEGLFEGYNGTVLAYGQTGAGKTYILGTNAAVDNRRSWQALIPSVSSLLFSKVAEESSNEHTEVAVKVSFFEVYQNSLRDLLGPKAARTEQTITIKEGGASGAICVEGHTEEAVHTPAELEACLHRGARSRATHATDMNAHSSRSHAIFTITVSLKRRVQTGQDGAETEERLTAKMHLVDLAGSERLKKSGVQGEQQKETASINLGLLALRNCIEALCEPGRSHVPYRANKLTRVLQDSLGGNARTVMVACVSPALSCMEETLSTLKYASISRGIKNRVVANRAEDKVKAMAAEIARLRAQLAAAEVAEAPAGAGLLERNLEDGAAQRLAALEGEREGWLSRAELAERRCAELAVLLEGLQQRDTSSSSEGGADGEEEIDLAELPQHLVEEGDPMPHASAELPESIEDGEAVAAEETAPAGAELAEATKALAAERERRAAIEGEARALAEQLAAMKAALEEREKQSAAAPLEGGVAGGQPACARPRADAPPKRACTLTIVDGKYRVRKYHLAPSDE
mmetsp:Transcript_11029/g.28281  ORF Transcript_11029/g.28281 Transcript_11029/m.28281 type:complete len:724 (-) Transcript_11029:489-2660(-)